MSKFSELLNKDKEYAEKAETKSNPFAALRKSVVAASTPLSKSTTDAEEVDGIPPVSEKTSSAPFSLQGQKKETATASLSVNGKTPPDTTEQNIMQGVSGDSFSEAKSSKEFQSEDQPDAFDQELVDKLKESLDILVNSMDNKELIGDALKQIMLSTKKHPFLADIMHPEDCQMMVRGLQESYGVTLAKKQVRGQKRAASSKDVEDIVDMLADVDISI